MFIDLMRQGNYKEASYVAACSPKGVLRNMETLWKFKGTAKKAQVALVDRESPLHSALEKPIDEDMSPSLFHCKVLAETALEAPFKPDLVMSLECARAACSENHLNLLYKWISEGRQVHCHRRENQDDRGMCSLYVLVDRLTLSFEMAQLVEQCQALDLAEFIYRQVKAHDQVASCLLQIGNSVASLRCWSHASSRSSIRFFQAMP